MDKITYQGTAVSEGVGIGKLFILEELNEEINSELVSENMISNEHKRLEYAIEKTKIELHDLKEEFSETLDKKDTDILDAYRMILQDRSFIQEIIDLINIYKYHSDFAVNCCINNIINAIISSDNEYMKERVYDFEDIKQRIIRNIHGENTKVLESIHRKNIVVVKRLVPSVSAILARKKVMGVIAEEGIAELTHSAIILRGLRIPAINGMMYNDLKKLNGKLAIIDGKNGDLILNPNKSIVDEYRNIYKSQVKKTRNIWKEFLRRKDVPAVTKDGHKICITLNIGSLEECEEGLGKNIDGIGLVRTELLFIKNVKMPEEKEQYLVYSKIIKKIPKKHVVIRTVDIGDEKNLGGVDLKTNSSIGKLRGVRFSMAQKEQFIKQLKAIIMASEFGDVRITFPMVYSEKDIIDVKKLMECIYEQIDKKKINKKIPIGAMIETKLAIEKLDLILKEVDFINLGTNDLLQEFMGFDRKKGYSQEEYFLNPSFLRIVNHCIEIANKAGKPVNVCGEMASDNFAAVLLIGMGVKELSMSPSKTKKVCSIIRKVDLDSAKKLVQKTFECCTIEEVIELKKYL